MDRLRMPGTMPADVAERLSDCGTLYDRADKAMLEQARDDLSEKLREGEKVGGLDLWALIESEVNNNDRWRIFLDEITTVLGAEQMDAHLRAGEANKVRDGLIERYLDSHPELIEERAAEILAEEAE